MDDDNEDGIGADAEEDVPTLLEDAVLDPDSAELPPPMLELPDVGSPSDEDRPPEDVPLLLLLLLLCAPLELVEEPPPEDEVVDPGGTHTLDWHTSPPVQGVTPSHAARQMPVTHAPLVQPWSPVQRGRHWPPAQP